MASIQTRRTADGHDRWTVRATGGAGGRRTFLSAKAAVRFRALVDAAGWDAAVRALDTADPQTTLTVAEVVTRHIDLLTGVDDGTRHAYRALADRHLGGLAAIPVTVLTRDLVAGWINTQASEAAGKSIRNRHALLSAALERAREDGLVAANPARGLRLPRTQTDSGVFLTHGQVARLLAELDPWWHPLVLTLFGTGIRYGEAAALQWMHVDLDDAPAVRIVRAVKKPTGAGAVRIGAPKTDRSRRTVPIDDAHLVTALRQLRARRDSPPGGLVFTGPSGGRLTNAWRDVAWRRAVEAALPDLVPRPTPHDARHTHASWLIAAGVPLVAVQRRLGHESITTTEAIYGHLARETWAAAAAAAGAAMQAVADAASPRHLQAV